MCDTTSSYDKRRERRFRRAYVRKFLRAKKNSPAKITARFIKAEVRRDFTQSRSLGFKGLHNRTLVRPGFFDTKPRTSHFEARNSRISPPMARKNTDINPSLSENSDKWFFDKSDKEFPPSRMRLGTFPQIPRRKTTSSSDWRMKPKPCDGGGIVSGVSRIRAKTYAMSSRNYVALNLWRTPEETTNWDVLDIRIIANRNSIESTVVKSSIKSIQARITPPLHPQKLRIHCRLSPWCWKTLDW